MPHRLMPLVEHATRATAYAALLVCLLVAATAKGPNPPTEPFVPRQLTEQERIQQDRQLLEQALDELREQR